MIKDEVSIMSFFFLNISVQVLFVTFVEPFLKNVPEDKENELTESETAEVNDITCCMNASQCVTSLTQKNKNHERQNTVGFTSDYRNSPHTRLTHSVFF